MNSMRSLPSIEDPSPDIPAPDDQSPEDPDSVADPVPGNSLITIKGRNKGSRRICLQPQQNERIKWEPLLAVQRLQEVLSNL